MSGPAGDPQAAGTPAIRVVLVDDQTLVRLGILSLIHI